MHRCVRCLNEVCNCALHVALHNALQNALQETLMSPINLQQTPIEFPTVAPSFASTETFIP